MNVEFSQTDRGNFNLRAWGLRERGLFLSTLLLSALLLSALLLFTLLGCNPGANNNTTANSAGAPSANVPNADDPNSIVPAAGNLEILVVSSPGLGEVIQRVWDSESEGSVSIKSISMEEFAAQNYRTPATTDVVVYPGAMQADLIASEQLLEIPADIWNGSEIGKAELLNYYRTNLVRYGSKYYAAPLGGQQLCLIYREDVLAAIGKNVPQTWPEFVLLVEQLHEMSSLSDAAGQSLPRSLALPLAYDWPAHLFLSIAAPSIRSSGKLSTVFHTEDLRPLIERAPFQESLQTLMSLGAVVPNKAVEWSPDDVYREMLAGRAALAITWPSHHFAASPADVSAQIKIATLPGSQRFFDFATDQWFEREPDDETKVPYLGIEQRVVSAARNSLHANQALSFVAWLASKRVSGQLASQSGWIGPFRNSQLADPQRWTGEGIRFEVAEQYASIIRNSHESKLAFVFPRVTQQPEMITQLASGIRDVFQELDSPDKMLNKLASRWKEMLEKPGLKLQRELLRRGEGL